MSVHFAAIRRVAARHRFSRPVQAMIRPLLGGDFDPQARVRLLIYHHPSMICWSLVEPYFREADAFSRRFGADFRTLPVDDFLAGRTGPEADIVIVQPWFTIAAEQIETAFARYRERHPQARLIFLDSYAHIDLRFGQAVSPYIDLYQRKALFYNKYLFLNAHEGDTNLTEYYGRLYGLQAEPTDWHVPKELLTRLALVPNFLTASYLTDGFLGAEPDFRDRPIDLHSRIAVGGTPWYSAMRHAARSAARMIEGIRLTPEEKVPRRKFLTEMRHARLCWSPFGYGELCWRDLEAFMTGAVLVKPDMSHIRTLPDLYVPGETYLPVKWDFSDLEKVVQDALADPQAQQRIALNAFRAARAYLQNGCFVTDMGRDLGLDK